MNKVDEKYLDQIHREVDGELSQGERNRLRDYLAESPEARRLHQDLTRLSMMLNEFEQVDPPADVKHAVMASIESRREEPKGLTGWVRTTWLAGAPVLQYACVFLAGIGLGFAAHLALEAGADVDVSGLAGTMSRQADVAHEDRADLHLDAQTGSIRLGIVDSDIVVDLDLESSQPVDVVLEYDPGSTGFISFEQQAGRVSSFAAREDAVALTIQGHQRSAVVLASAEKAPIEINFKILASGALLQGGSLRLQGRDDFR